MDDLDLIRAQLLAMQAQLEAMQRQVAAMLALVSPAPAIECLHPVDQREYQKGGTMGQLRRFLCRACEQMATESRPQAVGA